MAGPLTALTMLVGTGTAAAATSQTLYAFPGGSNAATLACADQSDGCSLQQALAQAAADAATEPVVVTLEPNPNSMAPQVFYGNWILQGASAADPITIDGNGQILDGDQGTVTGPCETSTSPGQPAGGCVGSVLTVADAGFYTISDLTIQNAQTFTASAGLENSSGGTVTVTDSTFSDDSAGDGGAIDNGLGGSGTVMLSDSTFSDDSASEGGAIDNADFGGTGSVTVTDSTFSDDSAINGGAILNGNTNSVQASVAVSDSTFSGDTAVGAGGAIDSPYASGGVNLTVTDSTFEGDSALGGPAIAHGGAARPTDPTLWVAGDVFADSASACIGGSGSWFDGGYNVVLAGDDSCLGGALGSTDVSASSAGLDPAGLTNHGGPVQTIALEASSPAIGVVPAGTTVSLANGELFSLCSAGLADQRGAPRETSPGAACDAGAFEVQQASLALSCPPETTFGSLTCTSSVMGPLDGPTGPTGNVTYSVYAGAGCAGTALASVSAPRGSGNWSQSLAAPGGGDSVQASYTDAVYTLPATACQAITVNPAPTVLTAAPEVVLFPPPKGVGLGVVSATLTGAGSPIVGRIVQFSTGSAALCSAVTNSSGVATCHPSLLGDLRIVLSNSYTATFTTDGDYQSASATTRALEFRGTSPATTTRGSRGSSLDAVRITVRDGSHRLASLTGRRLTAGQLAALARPRAGRYGLSITLVGDRDRAITGTITIDRDA